MRNRPNPNLMKKGSSRTYANGFTLEQIRNCRHRGKQCGTKRTGSCARCPGVPIYECALYEKCTLARTKGPEQNCQICTKCEPK